MLWSSRINAHRYNRHLFFMQKQELLVKQAVHIKNYAITFIVKGASWFHPSQENPTNPFVVSRFYKAMLPLRRHATALVWI